MAPKKSIDPSGIEKLNGRNFRAWKRHITFLLTHEKTLYTLTTPKPWEGIVEDDESESVNSILNVDKWIEHNAWAKALILHCMSDHIIPLFEDYETAKEIMDAVEAKYGLRSDTYIQLLLDKYNRTCMKESDDIGDHVLQMELMAKELNDAGHPLTDKMQVTTILNSLPSSWDHIITSLTHSGNEVTMISLPVLLVLEGERMKRRNKDSESSNLLMAQDKRSTQNKMKPKQFKKKKWLKRKQNKPFSGNCFKCGKKGHCKSQCPNKGKAQ